MSLTILAVLLTATLTFAEAVKITRGPVVEHAGPNNAVIAWSTNTSSPTIVHYGTDPNNLSERAEMPWGALTHRVTLKNLKSGETYYYQVDSSQGQNDRSGTSTVAKFTTAGQQTADHDRDHDADDAHRAARPELKITHGPVIEHVGDTTATVAWSTDLPSSTIVKYGTDPNHLTQTAEEPWGATTHRVELKNLRPRTQYYFSVHSAQGKNAPGQSQDTPPQAFTTSAGRGARR